MMAGNEDLTNAQLKELLLHVGLPRTGNKTTLLKRLQDFKRSRQCYKCRVIDHQLNILATSVKTIQDYFLVDCHCRKWDDRGSTLVNVERAPVSTSARKMTVSGGANTDLLLKSTVSPNTGLVVGEASKGIHQENQDEADVVIGGGTINDRGTKRVVVADQLPFKKRFSFPACTRFNTERQAYNLKNAEMVSSDQPIDLSRHGSQRRVMPNLIPLRLVRPNRPADTPPQPKRPRLDRARSVPQLAPLLPLQRAKSLSESRIARGSPEPWFFSQLLLQQLSIQRNTLEEDKPSTVVRDAEADAKRRPVRPLTGKHVRPGTGASPATLLTLRKKIQARQQQQPCTQPQGWDGSWNDILVKFPEATPSSCLESLKQHVETGKN